MDHKALFLPELLVGAGALQGAAAVEEAARSASIVGDISIVDVDRAAKGSDKDNTADILLMVAAARRGCRVSGGITDADTALNWLDKGVKKVVMEEATTREVLSCLPRARAVLRVSAEGDLSAARERAEAEREWVGEVQLDLKSPAAAGQGMGPELLKAIEALACALREGDKDKRVALTVAGCVATAEDAVALDAMGVRAQIGAPLRDGSLTTGDIVVALARSDRPDGLYSTVVVDEQGVALGLVYSDDASIRAACSRRKGIYHSRKRGLWEKGLTSGATQDLLGVALDCDRDALLYTVHQHGAGFCHLNRRSCWDADRGLGKLERTLQARRANAPEGSYTARLFGDAELLSAKLREEAVELIEASEENDKAHITFEAADVLYFASVVLAKHGVTLSDVEAHLDLKSLRVRRRKGDAKPAFLKEKEEK